MHARLICRPTFLVLTAYVLLCYATLFNAATLVVHPDVDDRVHYTQALQDLLPEAYCVKQISFDADIYFQEDEFYYLIGIKIGDTISYDQLAQAVYYLSKKQKFESIAISIEAEPDGIKLHFAFSSFWTFRKLKFKGIFVGKEHYRQYYVMEYGDRFDMKKHDESVKKIAESFKKDGYFSSHVDADFVYDEKTKSVIVYLDLHKGAHFAVGEIELCFESTLLDDQTEKSLLLELDKLFIAPLKKGWYNRALINAQTVELKNFLAKKGYLHLDIELEERVHHQNRQVDLIFTIHIYFQKNFRFIGNQFFTQAELLDIILAFGRSTTLLPASILSEELARAYHDRGFWDIIIDYQEEDGADTFIIKEGRRAHVTHIELCNLSYFNPKLITKKFFSSILKKGDYDVKMVDRAIEQVLTYFVSQGFWQSSLLQKCFEKNDGYDNSYSLIITFDEGEQNFISAVHIEGFEELECIGPFERYVHMEEKIPLNMALIEEQRHWLEQYFQKEGYYQPNIKPSFDKQDSGDIHLVWHVDLKHAEVVFDKTVLLDATTFPFAYVQRELDYKIGDPWHTDALRHSISRLQKLELFESVQLFPDKDAGYSSDPIMLLKLQKDDPFELKLRIGAGLQHVTKSLTTGGPTYRVGGSFIWKNPANRGDQLRLDADFTRAIRLVNGQYRIPWICNAPINAMLQGYTNRFEYPGFIGSQKNLYTVIQQGFLVNFTSVYNSVDAALSSGIEVVDTFIDDSKENCCYAREVARAINFKPELLDKNIPFFLLQPTLMLFYLDNTINPTRGSFSVLSAKGMFPMAKLSPHNFFIRILAEQSFFVPIMPLVFALRLRVGHIFHPQFSTIIPIERFYLGGANSIRSYETDQCPPLGVVNDNGKELFVPQGGRSLVNLNLEMRFPLYREFGGVIFGDIGALSTNRLADICADDMLSGIGFGLRYNTAIGPLRFDVAWRGHKHDGVGRPYAWFLSFGNAFV